MVPYSKLEFVEHFTPLWSKIVKKGKEKGKMYGQRIRELRLEQGLTQNELAQAINTTQKSISKYETEYLDLNTDMIIALCKYFNVSADYLLGLTDSY